LSGGGTFGAWEAGALQALWSVWALKHNKEEPPIRIVAGTSAGALTAPFALGTQAHVDSIVKWWTTVDQNQISTPNLGLLLPAIAFLALCDGLSDFGDPEANACSFPTEYRSLLNGPLRDAYKHPNRENPRLYGNYKTALQDRGLKTLELCRDSWPDKRLGIATTDFGGGQGDVVTNSPDDTASKKTVYESRLYRGIFASAITPLMGYPVLLSQGGASGPKTPHFDGGVYSEAPFNVLFALASTAPAIPLTHVIVISAYPFFPGSAAPGTPKFPRKPNFEKIGLRFDTLVSEASATKDTLLARAALKLRALGQTESNVRDLTGLTIPSPPPVLIEAAPKNKLGWDNATVNRVQMKHLAALGEREARKIFMNSLP
jgi:predicted acylesterase/phospholipase RssA